MEIVVAIISFVAAIIAILQFSGIADIRHLLSILSTKLNISIFKKTQNQKLSPIFTISRSKEIRRLADRIRTGQSSAIIGFFSEERRTILGYLRNENPKQQEELYGDKANQLIFSYIDIAFLDKECSPPQFWEMALEPLRIKMTDSEQLEKAYQVCKDNQFDRRSLENLISVINQKSWQLVLLLDKFEELLQHPHFKKNWEFFTTLRYLAASRTPSPLVLVIASNQSLEQFHKKIQYLSPLTSPILNFIEWGLTTLGSLSEAEVDNLLEHNDPPIPEKARQFIKNMVGGHPYLLNVAVSELWKISPNGELESVETLEKAFYDRIKYNLERIINSWSQNTSQAFQTLVKQGQVVGFENELKELETQGLVAKVNEQWQIRSRIFSIFLAEKDKQQILES
jgi:hypothetical protein